MQYARKQYLDQLIRKKDNGRIKIITGLRRSGKSYLLFDRVKLLLENQLARKSWRSPTDFLRM